MKTLQKSGGKSENFFRSLSRDDMYGNPKLTWWVPHYRERQLILQLAHAITDGTKQPTILEAGCGSGLVSKLLAVDNQADVIGIDPAMEQMGHQRLGMSPGNAQFLNTDFWDVLDQFSPQADSRIGMERRQLLAKIRGDYIQNGPVFSPLYHEFQSGVYARLSAEVAMLQELTRQEAPTSPVDLVICSFMPPRIDLTVPIRDGIYPKAIIYVRAPEGFVGAGDFYQGGEYTIDDETGEKDALTQDTVISLNPGRNYYTAGKWMTTCANQFFFGGEVIVQLRNDVTLKPIPTLSLEQYNFDGQIISELERRRMESKMTRDRHFKDKDLIAEVNNATDALFHS